MFKWVNDNMPEGFNELETAILVSFQRHYRNERLSAQIESARFVERHWTGVGVFVSFEVSKELPSVDLNDFRDYWPIDGPGLRSADIQNGGATMLWGEGGYADCMEMYAYGDYFNEHVKDFELTAFNTFL